MSLSNQDAKTLQDIVNIEGKCMEASRCKACPFRALCLPEFLNPIPPTPQQRVNIAMDILTHHHLLDEDASVQSIKEGYKWDKK